MVSGPFAYVADPSQKGRLVFVGPDDSDHGPPAIYAGDDATHPAGQPTLPMGIYNIDIDNLQPCGTTKAGSPSLTTYHLDGIDPIKTIKPMLDGPRDRYAFSLPQPCSYVSKFEAWQKIADSGVGPEKSYTIMMELHYLVSNANQAHLLGTSDQHHLYKIDLNLAGKAKNAFSIVMTAPPFNTDPECDSVSAESVIEAGDLFGRNLSVRMPQLDFAGNQRKSVYSLNCIGLQGLADLACARAQSDPSQVAECVEDTKEAADCHN